MRPSLSNRRSAMARLLAAALAPAPMPAPAHAQAAWPVRPITLVIPFPPGGQTDVVGRLVGERLSQRLGQPVVVENRPGVNGSLASEAVARARADGYTLVIGGPGTHAINQLVNSNVKYDARRDFTHIAMLGRVPMLLLASPRLKVASVADVVALAQASPGMVNVALTGIGSSSHVTTELLRQAAGVSFNNVPYKGDVPAMTDVMGGQADLLFVPATSAVGFAQAGKLRALAVAGERRLAALPDVPTMAEAGQPQVVNYSWTSLAGPPGMPADVVERLNQACQSLLAEPEVVARLAAMSNEPTPGTPAQAASFIAAEVARWSEVVRKGNIQVQ
ncbi:Bug family tripartite tricarboxylate transporter substrate binding protein [Delftia sp. CH05]|uniref:Bug family tripartite tricarboxylate transporter substrate binding protein n=1 Tax=Delftia sp. CH05 TaxID=2692194 RepID=UPI00135D94DD|nr:tripartite tricarboxylate transporter substrate binding protein [Delftia sp. CH05]MXN31329.1 tripartite tricarboxylate transporter substrate binding protein [Delftia sp. CH05]